MSVNLRSASEEEALVRCVWFSIFFCLRTSLSMLLTDTCVCVRTSPQSIRTNNPDINYLIRPQALNTVFGEAIIFHTSNHTGPRIRNRPRP